MTTMISDFLAAGLFDGVDGDDSRITKMEKAAENLATELKGNPPKLIRAILAGIDPDIPEEDPAIQEAMVVLTNEWKSVNSVHPDTPINILRAIILEACIQASDDKNASILWLTMADTYPMIRLGKESQCLSGVLSSFAHKAEESAIAELSRPVKKRKTNINDVELVSVATKYKNIDRAEFLTKVAGTACKNYKNNTLTKANRYHPHQHPNEWSWDFADNMTEVLADEFDSLSLSFISKLNNASEKQVELLKKGIDEQRKWVQSATNAIDSGKVSEKMRLDTLWWSEALYSPSMTKSYRELPLEVATVSMAIDLVNIVTKPTPASVGYLLAESVNKLPEADFSKKHKLFEVLNQIRESQRHIPEEWGAALIPPPKEGRLSIRDLFVSALTQENLDTNQAMRQAGIRDDYEMSYPQLAHALFRQEQAVQLAGA